MRYWILLFLLCCGCIPARYASLINSGGYSHFDIGEGKVVVSFFGSQFTEIHRAQDYALLRAAELTLLYGYEYFVVEKGEYSKERLGPYAITGDKNHEGNSGVNKSDRPKRVLYPENYPELFAANLLITMYKEPPDKLSLRAYAVLNSLWNHYKLPAEAIQVKFLPKPTWQEE